MTKTNRPLVLEIVSAVKKKVKPERGAFLQRFFKTGPGQYGEGDVFWGLTVPEVRQVARAYQAGVQLQDIEQLLKHETHEIRLLALIMLVDMFKKGSPELRTQIFSFYLNQLQHINNWDLVDTSAAEIVGTYIYQHPAAQNQVTQLQTSPQIWPRRVSIIAMFPFVKAGEFELPLRHISGLINDSHDLIQKANGWVLRAIGDQDLAVLRTFLDSQARTMPRTALRYAIEHLSDTERKKYLQLKNT